jgi:hypothetical protein
MCLQCRRRFDTCDAAPVFAPPGPGTEATDGSPRRQSSTRADAREGRVRFLWRHRDALAATACLARRADRSASGGPSPAPAKGTGPGLQDPSIRPAGRWKGWSDAVDVYAQIEQIFREADRPSSADCDGSIMGRLHFSAPLGKASPNARMSTSAAIEAPGARSAIALLAQACDPLRKPYALGLHRSYGCAGSLRGH